jgi:pimeloyl-ACP methyl ester carboxylesterase
MASSPSAPQSSGKAHDLAFESYNDEAAASSPTILLLHAMGTSRREWDLVLPYVLIPDAAYHVLVVDMPGHSASASARCPSIPAQADRLAQLIESHAHQGRAHLAGVSMGGFVAVEIARRHPDLVRSVFSSGAAPYEGARLWATEHASWFDAYSKVTTAITPRWLDSWITEKKYSVQGMRVSEALRRDIKTNDSVSMGTIELFESIGRDCTMEGMSEVRVRTLTVAGGKMDAVDATRKQGQKLREGCDESRAAVIKAAWHMWQLQLPELFAKSLMAWIEGRELPKEMQLLEPIK